MSIFVRKEKCKYNNFMKTIEYGTNNPEELTIHESTEALAKYEFKKLSYLIDEISNSLPVGSDERSLLKVFNLDENAYLDQAIVKTIKETIDDIKFLRKKHSQNLEHQTNFYSQPDEYQENIVFAHSVIKVLMKNFDASQIGDGFLFLAQKVFTKSQVLGKFKNNVE